MVNGRVEFKIYKDNAKRYESYRKFIRCFSDKCPVKAMCFQEKKASRNAKHLAYRIILNKPCEEAYGILSTIEALPHLMELENDYRNQAVWYREATSKLRKHIFNLKSKLTTLQSNKIRPKGKRKKVKFEDPYAIFK